MFPPSCKGNYISDLLAIDGQTLTIKCLEIPSTFFNNRNGQGNRTQASIFLMVQCTMEPIANFIHSFSQSVFFVLNIHSQESVRTAVNFFCHYFITVILLVIFAFSIFMFMCVFQSSVPTFKFFFCPTEPLQKIQSSSCTVLMKQ